MAEILNKNKDLHLLFAYQQARALYVSSLLSHADKWRDSQNQDAITHKERQLLLGPYVESVAQFFLASSSILKEDNLDVRPLLSRHNEAMEDILRSSQSENSRGFSDSGVQLRRLEEAMFNSQQIARVEHDTILHKTLTLDQRSLSKLLVKAMSPETCRTVVLLLASVGLLNRRDLRPVVVINSNGELESIYAEFLNSLQSKISEV